MDNNPNVVEIPISEDIINYLQMLDYEISGLKILHTHALLCNAPEEKCEKIKKEFLEKYEEMQVLKSEIEKQYLSDLNGQFASWQINYNRGMMYVTKN